MKLSFRIEQEFGRDEPIKPVEHLALFQEVAKQLNILLETNKSWYEKGYSRKQALQHKVFTENEVSEGVLARWEKEYKKEYKKDFPVWTRGIWDGGPDGDSAGINLYPSFSSTHRRKNPLNLVITFVAELNRSTLNVDKMLVFFTFLLHLNDNCTYACVESGGYSFPDIIPNENGYDEVYKQVFPDRITCGWMLYVPHLILPELIPEAARVVPVMEGDKQKGTIVVSTEEIFDGNNKEHISKANDIEIKLLDLGLLPLITEL